MAHGYPPAKWQKRNRNIVSLIPDPNILALRMHLLLWSGVQVGEMGPELGQEAGARSQAPRVSMRE